MRNLVLVAALSVCALAHAGYVDERSSVAPASADAKADGADAQGASALQAAPAGYLSGNFDEKGWAETAPTLVAAMPLAEAIAKLLPAALQGVVIQASESVLDAQVLWKPGVTRRAALEQVASSNGFVISLVGRTLNVTKAVTPKVTGAAAAVPALTWSVLPGDVRLVDAINRWAAKAGYSVRWDADRQVLVEGTTEFTGTFEQAVAAALSTPGIANGPYPLESCVYPNKPPLLRVTRKGEQVKDCPEAVSSIN